MSAPTWPPAYCTLCRGPMRKIATVTLLPQLQRASDCDPLVPLLRCQKCGTLVQAMPLRAMTAYLQGAAYTDPAHDASSRLRRIPFFTWLLGEFVADLPRSPNTTILDFGAGFGHLTGLLHEGGYSATGVEAYGRAASHAASKGAGPRMVDSLYAPGLKPAGVDAIFALDSLYYVPDVHATLERMAELLRPGGRLIVRAMNADVRLTLYRLGAARWSKMSPLGDALWGFSLAGLGEAISSVGLTIQRTCYMERSKYRGHTRVLALAAGAMTAATGGRLLVAPGWIVTAAKGGI